MISTQSGVSPSSLKSVVSFTLISSFRRTGPEE